MLTHEDRQAIDGLFDRLREAERRGGPRDAEAEAYIRRKMAEQAGAAYYLAQTVVVQQEALREAERRIEALEREGRQIERGRGPWDRAPSYEDRHQHGGGGFLAGAAQTALGVAGGMMLGSLIGSIFSTGAANASEYDNGSADDNGNDAGNDQGADAGADDGGFDGGGDFGDGGGFDMGGDF